MWGNLNPLTFFTGKLAQRVWSEQLGVSGAFAAFGAVAGERQVWELRIAEGMSIFE